MWLRKNLPPTGWWPSLECMSVCANDMTKCVATAVMRNSGTGHITPIQVRRRAPGTTLILAATIALAGGLVAIGLAANRSVVWWVLGIGEGAAGVVALAFGVPIHKFTLG